MQEMQEDTEPQEVMDVVEDFAAAEASLQEEAEAPPVEPTQVPLSALQKERKKRQELEQELNYLRQRSEAMQKQEPVDDSAKYESATKEDLMKSQMEAIRAFEERQWIRNNPEKYEKVNELLPEFIKNKPNYAYAINEAQNRFEEAYTLMEALTPKQQAALKPTPATKKVAPNSPGGVPKAAALNEAVDVMKMSDAEFAAWRKSQKRR